MFNWIKEKWAQFTNWAGRQWAKVAGPKDDRNIFGKVGDLIVAVVTTPFKIAAEVLKISWMTIRSPREAGEYVRSGMRRFVHALQYGLACDRESLNNGRLLVWLMVFLMLNMAGGILIQLGYIVTGYIIAFAPIVYGFFWFLSTFRREWNRYPERLAEDAAEDERWRRIVQADQAAREAARSTPQPEPAPKSEPKMSTHVLGTHANLELA